MLVKDMLPSYIEGTPISIEILNIRHISPHRHCDAIEFVYCFKGNLKITIAHQNDLPISSGDLALVDREDIHYITSDEDNCTLIIHINTSCFGNNCDDINCVFFSCATQLCREYQKHSLNQVINILLTIAYLYILNGNNSLRELRQLTDRLVRILLSKFRFFSVEGLDSEENEKYYKRLDAIIAYIQCNYNQKITIAEIANKIYMDSNYLSQFLKRTSFYSFTFMVNYIRAYEAEKLLLFTDKSIQKISEECGFSDVKYFHKYFKRFWGITPLQHRIRYRKLTHVPEDFSIYSSGEALKITKNEIINLFITEELNKADQYKN